MSREGLWATRFLHRFRSLAALFAPLYILYTALTLKVAHECYQIWHAVLAMTAQQRDIQEAQLMLTTGATRLAVSRGQQTRYHFGSFATFR